MDRMIKINGQVDGRMNRRIGRQVGRRMGGQTSSLYGYTCFKTAKTIEERERDPKL